MRTALAMCCAVLLTACGGSGGHSSGGDPGLNFARCMRAHGVTNFADPTSGGGIQIPANVNPRSPVFQRAQSACSRYLPGGPLRGQATAEMKQRLLNMARCMRSRGLVNFPDPVAKPPSPGAGFGLAFGSPGAVIAIPQSMLGSPEFRQAASACGLPGAGHLPKGAQVSPAPVPKS